MNRLWHPEKRHGAYAMGTLHMGTGNEAQLVELISLPSPQGLTGVCMPAPACVPACLEPQHSERIKSSKSDSAI